MARQPSPWRRGGDEGAWYAQVRGRKVWLAPGEAGKAEAQEALYRVMAESGAPGPRSAPGRGLTVRQVLNAHLLHCRGEVERGERTAKGYDDKGWFLDRADASFGAVDAAAVRAWHVLGWIDATPSWGPSTRSLAIRHVKAAFRWAEAVGRLAADPLARLRAPKTRRRERIPTVAAADAVLAAAEGPFRDFLFALMESGCRPGEVWGLTAAMVDPDRATWTVPNKTRRKTGEATRTVYLTPALVELSRRLMAEHPDGPIFRNDRGRPWRRSVVGRRMIQLRERLGLGPEVCAYAMRHRFVTTALVNDVPVATVATLVGHRRTDMVMTNYSRLDLEDDHLREAVKQARGVAPPVNPDDSDAPPAAPAPPR